VIGEPFEVIEATAIDVLAGLGRYTIAVNDPPWSAVAGSIPPPVRVIDAWEMELSHLDRLVAEDVDCDVVVGFGGGTALDTAKYLAWRTGRRLVQIPTITSVDAGFTDAVGIRDSGRVRYVGVVRPESVVLDLDLIRSAPLHLNRAGIGDILSCHTGLFDWRLAVDAGHDPPWRHDLGDLGRVLLGQLADAAPDIAAVSTDGVRFLADAYRRIGAACAEAGHSRFEEGSEHHWAYCYEHRTGAHQVHGELIAFAVVAMSVLQGNDPEWAADLVARTGCRAHPDDLGITREQYVDALVELPDYALAEALDITFATLDRPAIDLTAVSESWELVCSLPKGR